MTPTHLYLIVHSTGALKVGVSSRIQSRLADHAFHGWTPVMTWNLGPRGALPAEREMLAWLKTQGEYPPTEFRMPQGGLSEVWMGKRVSKETALVRLAAMYGAGLGWLMQKPQPSVDPLGRRDNPHWYSERSFRPYLPRLAWAGLIAATVILYRWIYLLLGGVPEEFLIAAGLTWIAMWFVTNLVKYPLNPAYYQHKRTEKKRKLDVEEAAAAWEREEDARIATELARIDAEVADREWGKRHFPNVRLRAWGQLASRLGLDVKTVQKAYRSSDHVRSLLEPELDDIALALIRWQQRIHKMAPEERLGPRYAIYGQLEGFHLTSTEGVPLCEKAPGARPGSYRLLKTTGDRRKCRICESIWEERVRSIDL